jgi:polyisoprenyl-phosphate glycosyltransferase
MKKIILVTPVYNDWLCLEKLTAEVFKTPQLQEYSIQILAVNDCSTVIPSSRLLETISPKVEILDLLVNVGHQRAILVGLCYALEHYRACDYIVVMDSDGEDNPHDIPRLIALCQQLEDQKVIFAKRSKRSEPLVFRIMYQWYKLSFRMLTGDSISFGNFSVIPRYVLERICHDPNFWNHYSSAMLKSRIPLDFVPSERSKRYFGHSNMNFNSLVIHGLSSISVYMECITVRILKVSLLVFFLLLLGFASVVYVKFFTDMAIPGWATYIFGFLFNALITVTVFNLLIILMQLNSRNKPIEMPFKFYKNLTKTNYG